LALIECEKYFCAKRSGGGDVENVESADIQGRRMFTRKLDCPGVCRRADSANDYNATIGVLVENPVEFFNFIEREFVTM
jgi:hypothetical protein